MGGRGRPPGRVGSLEVAVRTAGVPAGLRALPADGMGCPEAQPEVLLLQ